MWLGRFQPFHAGHLEYLKGVLDATKTCVMLGVIVSTEESGGDDQLYSRVASAQHSHAKNPLGLWERIALIELSLQAAGLSESVKVLGIPRPDQDRILVQGYLPPRRFICVSDKNEFECLKAQQWTQAGEDVRVFPSGGGISATAIKAVLRSGGDWEQMLAPGSVEFFRSIDGPERLRRAE